MLTTWIKSPIPYAGCKFDMLDELEAVIGSGETLVDMFTGSGVVGANMAPRFERVLCIDVLADLIAMHDNFKRDDPDAIIEKMRGGVYLPGSPRNTGNSGTRTTPAPSGAPGHPRTPPNLGTGSTACSCPVPTTWPGSTCPGVSTKHAGSGSCRKPRPRKSGGGACTCRNFPTASRTWPGRAGNWPDPMVLSEGWRQVPQSTSTRPIQTHRPGTTPRGARRTTTASHP